MDNLGASEANFIGIAVHNSDPMANSYYDGVSETLPGFSGYPYACADRVEGDHAYYISNGFDTRKTLTPAAAVMVGANYDAGSNVIHITVAAKFDSDESGAWTLGAIVCENNVTGTSSSYGQHNYFSDATYGPDGSGSGHSAGPLNGAGHDWDASPDPIPAAEMVYDFVARKCANDNWEGDAGSLPTTMTTGSTYYYTYDVTKQSTWDLAELYVVGILVEPDGSINNANSIAVTESSNGIAENEISFGLSVYPNPTEDVTNIKVSTEETADVTVEVYNLMGELVYTESTQNLTPGKYYYPVDVTDFASGIYTVKTTVNNTVKTAKLSVK